MDSTQIEEEKIFSPTTNKLNCMHYVFIFFRLTTIINKLRNLQNLTYAEVFDP